MRLRCACSARLPVVQRWDMPVHLEAVVYVVVLGQLTVHMQDQQHQEWRASYYREAREARLPVVQRCNDIQGGRTPHAVTHHTCSPRRDAPDAKRVCQAAKERANTSSKSCQECIGHARGPVSDPLAKCVQPATQSVLLIQHASARTARQASLRLGTKQTAKPAQKGFELHNRALIGVGKKYG
jgi:hypothetical protein